MGTLFRSILNKLSPGGRVESLEIAIFGKHPGASDHFEYIPAEDEILNEIWTLLYRRAMEELIAGWNEMDPKGRLAEFNHVWLWSRGHDWVAGRMWTSVDSTGRAHFPLVVCVHGTGPITSFVLKSIFPAMARVEKQCKQTTSIQSVREYADKIRTELREQAASYQAIKPPPVSFAKALVDLPEFQQHPDQLQRLLFPLSHDLIEKDESESKILGDIPASYSLRMPRCVETAEESALVWHEILARLTGAATQMIMIAPVDYPWVDILAGNISPAGLFCIKASLERRRFSIDGDQKITPSFVEGLNRFVKAIEKESV